MIVRALLVLVVAVAAGLALSAALLGTNERYGGPIGGEWWIPLFVATGTTLGWFAARTLPLGRAIPISALAAPLAIATVSAVKVIRWPSWPAVGAGEGFILGLALYAIVGVSGAFLGRVTTWPSLPGAVRWSLSLGVLALASVGTSLLVLYVGLLFGGS